MKKSGLNTIIILAFLSMLLSGILLLRIAYKDKQSQEYWKQIAIMKQETSDWDGQGILPAYQSLYDKNKDIVGWIELEGERIDFPVMQTKEEPEFYLRRNFDKEEEDLGTPFVDYRCDVIPYRSFNTIIYGHYTDSDAMFRRLLNYESPKWYEEHKYIRFDTLLEEGLYEVAAVFYANVGDVLLMEDWNPEEEDAYAFYNYIEIDSQEGFERYKKQIENLKLYETQAEITKDKHIITLICCAPEEFSGYKEDGRFIVIAVEAEKIKKILKKRLKILR